MTDAPLELCILASGSRGNCSVVRVHEQGRTHLVLIDLGLSPRRTRAALRALGHELDEVDSVLFTHLDHDHAHAGWCGVSDALPRHVECFVPRSHLGRAERSGLNAGRLLRFWQPFSTRSGVRVRPIMNRHDELGSAAFRMEFAGAALGLATDLGGISDELVSHLRGVSVLAIESNYCPARQRDAARPEFLKRRVMGGAGHLSNGQSAEAVRRVGPTDHVVLLHLSRQCNEPALAAAAHHGLACPVTISDQYEPTGWIPVPARGQMGARVETDASSLFVV